MPVVVVVGVVVVVVVLVLVVVVVVEVTQASSKIACASESVTHTDPCWSTAKFSAVEKTLSAAETSSRAQAEEL